MALLLTHVHLTMQFSILKEVKQTTKISQGVRTHRDINHFCAFKCLSKCTPVTRMNHSRDQKTFKNEQGFKVPTTDKKKSLDVLEGKKRGERVNFREPLIFQGQMF